MASIKLLFVITFTFIYISTNVKPVKSQGLLESIRNGIQNVIRPRQEREKTNTEQKVINSTSKVNQENAASSNNMQNQIRNPVHYPIFV